MPENLELELHKLFKASQEKYIYFMMAAAGSAIGFAMTQTKAEPLCLIHIPLGLAILLWAVSFIFGLRFVRFAASVTFQNQQYLSLKRELRQVQGEAASTFEEQLKKALKTGVKKQSNKMYLSGEVQRWSLLLGSLAYIVWHGLRMWALTI